MSNIIKCGNKTNIKKENKMKLLIGLSPYLPIDRNGLFTSHHSLFTRKCAFTLAEVLITLGIIGVVAALTIPNLVNNYKAKRLHTQFLKSYSTVQQVFKQMEADDVSLDPNTYPHGTFYRTFMNYLQGAFDCGSNAVGTKHLLPCYGYTWNYSSDKNAKPYKSLDSKSEVSGNWFDDGQIALQDGTLLLFENNSNNDGNIWVSVDLNGYNNPPNRWGYDLFTFQFIDGELKTMGDNGTKYTNMTSYCNPKTTNTLNGLTCAQKAKANSDYFKDIIKEFK